MKRTPQLVLAIGSACAAVVTVVSAGSASAAPPPSTPLSPQSAAAQSAAGLVAAQPAALKAGADERFVQRGVTSSSGLQFVSYDRSFKGLPVIGGDFVVVTDNAGSVRDVSVAQERTIGQLSVSPKITSARAEEVARGQLEAVDSAKAPALAVYTLGEQAQLVWAVDVTGVNGTEYSRKSVYVDALTGSVVDSVEHVLDGTGTSAWNGPNPITVQTTVSGSNFLLRDPAHTTVQCQDAANNRTFTGTDDVWGNGNATSRETGCLDALFAAETEERMLSAWLGRNSFDGAGRGWPIRVGLNDLNAFYDGTQIQIGHNQQNQWISSLDVVAHEHGHGIDDHTPGGISRRGTQEFVGDVFGASTEWFANEPAQFDGPDFLVGERINLVGQGPIRNMFNPAALGDPNCYSNAVPNMEVHAAAGVGNHWFYLLAQGSNPTNGQPTSPTCNGARVTGVGVQTAARIFYNAMLMKTTASSYLRYRTWTLIAAKNLTPGNCANFNAVRNAWNAVSVPAQAADPTC
ncbi:MAG: M4 family metallopeptidase [Labedaea sp.]